MRKDRAAAHTSCRSKGRRVDWEIAGTGGELRKRDVPHSIGKVEVNGQGPTRFSEKMTPTPFSPRRRPERANPQTIWPGRPPKAYERVGFEQEGLMRRAAFVDGSWADVIVMAVLRP